MLKKISIITLLYLSFLFVVYYYYLYSVDKKANFIFYEEKKIDKYSYYKLNTIEIYSTFGEKRTYIKIQVSLVYPFQDHNVEKDIIVKRNTIEKLIHSYLAKKTYNQINNSHKREAFKKDLLKEINKILRYPILDIYYSQFWVMNVDA